VTFFRLCENAVLCAVDQNKCYTFCHEIEFSHRSLFFSYVLLLRDYSLMDVRISNWNDFRLPQSLTDDIRTDKLIVGSHCHCQLLLICQDFHDLMSWVATQNIYVYVNMYV